jgi:hypothetical protein
LNPLARLDQTTYDLLLCEYRLEAKNGTDALTMAREYKGPIHLMITT